jgi:NAD(P)-dependent dehydrogenase (short-subunit alcohol dehydrogenase family)
MTDRQHRFGCLDGKVAVVTGGASGIGAGIAAVLAGAGAWVVIADRDTAGAQREALALTEQGLDAAALYVELADEDSIVQTCAHIVTTYGTPWLLVNNAGVQDREFLLETTSTEWAHTLDINARAPLLMIRELGRAMVDAGQGGRIVNISSAVLQGMATRGLAAYASSKGALLALSRISAMELADHQITVNTVLPGGVITPGAINSKGPAPQGPAAQRMPPLGFADPREIGAAVLFFAAPEAARVTNQALAIDGGFSVI